MAVRPLGGYDPSTGWPPDDSTNVPWEDNVDLPGSFGRGGFHANPRITGPATGPARGLSLSGAPVDGINMSLGPDDTVTPPINSSIPPGKQVGPWTNEAQDAITRSGKPYSVNPIAAAAPFVAAKGAESLAKHGVMGTLFPGISSWFGGGGPTPAAPQPGAAQPGNQTGVPGVGPGPTITPPPGILAQPDHPSTMRYPGWPTPPAPAPGGDPRTGEGAGWGPTAPNAPGATVPLPIGSPAPAMPPRDPRRVPRSAGPAAVKQQPNLGAYTGPPPGMIYRPNADAAGGGRGPRNSNPYMGVADLSKLFSRQP